ncbi:Uncharacterised protein [Candidatus Anstonella stagnisolia]|nr:Uncharacterised protein [Candidatus Anstonella stagnisolia]
MGSSSVVGKAFLIAVALISFAALSLAVAASPCSDGTAYGKCSTVTPGKYCIGTLSAPALIDGASLCPCPAGYTTNGDVCDKQTCTDGTGYNECSSTIGKTWFRCENGQLIERASACACPSDYHKDGEKCAINDGCLYNKPACPPDKYCDNENSNATYNSCVPRGGCQYNNPACTDSQTCQSDGTCKLKSGCKYNNPGCNLDKEVCRNNECVAKSAFDGLTANSITNATTPDSSSGNSLSCCCLPAAGGLVTLAGAFAIRRKKEE